MKYAFSRRALLTLVTLVIGLQAQAAQVSFNASGTVTNASGIRTQFAVGLADSATPLPPGTLVEFGYYTNGIPAPAGANVTQAVLDQLRSGFVKWGTNMINQAVVPGRVTNVVQNTLFGGTPPTNQVVVWIWNTANSLTATQVGVFTATNWRFPNFDSGIGSASTLILATNYLNFPNGLMALAGGFDPVSDPLRQATLGAIGALTDPPIILQQPRGTNLPVGGTATLSVAASSSTPVSFQWTKNDLALPGATGTTLVVVGTTTNESGGYYAIVSNAAGYVYSQTALVRFGYPAGIGEPPVPVVAIAGGPATFSVDPSGTPPFTYEWRKNGKPLSGQTNAELALASVTASDMGSYSVMVSNFLGSALSSGASLTVLDPPFITQSPQGTNVVQGYPFTLQVGAGGSPPLSYQWWRGAAPLAGATSMVLSVSTATTNDGGAYSAVVMGPGGVATSAVATVDVIVPARYLSVAAPAGGLENGKFDVDVLLESSGEVSGMNLKFMYPDAYLTLGQVAVAGVFAGQYAEWTISGPGEVTLVLSAGLEASVPAGVERVVTFTFRARSVPTNAVASFRVVPEFLSDVIGNSVQGHTEVLGDATALAQRAWLGDNNNNGRMDPADASYLMRLQLNTNQIRPWDVSLNDLNTNGQMEVGDVTRVLRIISRLDPAVPNPAAPVSGQVARVAKRTPRAPAPAPLGTGNARLGLTRLTGANTNKLVADVFVSGLTNGIAGVSLQVDYLPSILSITGAASLTVPVGGLPLSALKQWNVAPTNAYSAQSGTVYFSASWDSSYIPPTNVPVARIVFDILPAATSQVNVPLLVSIPASEFLPLVTGRIELSPYDAGSPADPFGVAAEGATFKRTFADWSGALIGTGTVTWADFDGDGQSNWLEYLASTDPRARGSRFAVSSTAHGPDGFTVTWEGRPGVKYRVLGSTDLLNWKEVPDSQRTGTGAAESVTDAAASPTGKYYRVEILP